jgi:hypothetical protein
MPKFQVDEEALKASLAAILEEIDSLDDPEELNELRRIFRKSVPLFRRAYVAAWLLKKARLPVSGEGNGRRQNREPRPPRETREAREAREPKEPREPREDRETEAGVSRENMTTLFVGIGRTRRVYPRDLMGLLLENCQLDKDDIGNIKILDNYSFVDIANEKAQAVIDTLGNFEFRGRPLNVNFAKKKE